MPFDGRARPRDIFASDFRFGLLAKPALMRSVRFSHIIIQIVVAFTATALLGRVAYGQYAEDNVIAAADDSFGKSIDFQNVGLYSQNSVRGFSPQQAGNLRIEGLYFDQQTYDFGSCITKDTTVRIGLAALAYGFPAPTGIVDISLRKAGNSLQINSLATAGPYGQKTIQTEVQGPLMADLGIHLCGAFGEHYILQSDRHDSTAHFGSTVEWHPSKMTRVILFVSRHDGHASELTPAVYTNGTVPTTLFATSELASPASAHQGWREFNYGFIVHFSPSSNITLSAGIFRSAEHDPALDNLYFSLTSVGSGDLFTDVSPSLHSSSTSGEFDFTHIGTFDAFSTKLQLSVRGRYVSRDFAGDTLASDGLHTLADSDPFSAAYGVPGSPNVDKVRQHDLGLAYTLEKSGYGVASVSVMSISYTRMLQFANLGNQSNSETPLLVSGRISTPPIRPLVAYASYTHGLEDSALPPLSATNRGEPPAASRSSQLDAGLKLTTIPNTTLLMGAFQIRKPFFDLDPFNIYRNTGQINARGEELSVTYASGGLTTLLGAVHVVPSVHTNVFSECAVDCTSLGTTPVRAIAGIDYARSEFGASAQYSYESARPAGFSGVGSLSHQNILSAGLRYIRKTALGTVSIRLDALNLGNERSIDISSVGLITPVLPRRVMVSVAADM